MKIRKTVYCRGCAHLLVLRGEVGMLILCVARCKFKHGALRKRVHLVGWRMAERVNRQNDCAWHTPRFWAILCGIGFRIFRIKNWLRKHTGSQSVSLKDYSVREEYQKQVSYEQASRRRRSRGVVEDDDPEDADESQQALFED